MGDVGVGGWYVFGEQPAPAEVLVGHDADAPDVHSFGVAFAAFDFRCHVVPAPAVGLGSVALEIHNPRHPEVDDSHPKLGGKGLVAKLPAAEKDDVAGFEVSVVDPAVLLRGDELVFVGVGFLVVLLLVVLGEQAMVEVVDVVVHAVNAFEYLAVEGQQQLPAHAVGFEFGQLLLVERTSALLEADEGLIGGLLAPVLPNLDLEKFFHDDQAGQPHQLSLALQPQRPFRLLQGLIVPHLPQQAVDEVLSLLGHFVPLLLVHFGAFLQHFDRHLPRLESHSQFARPLAGADAEEFEGPGCVGVAEAAAAQNVFLVQAVDILVYYYVEL